jgi:hypothetical protein
MLTRSLAAVLVLSALACQGEARVEAAPAVVVAAAVPVAAPGTLIVSFATFVGDRLNSCSNVTAVLRPGEEHLREELASKATGNNLMRLSKPCEPEFAQRAVLATCVVSVKDVTVTTRYYDARAVVDSDASMRECLSNSGQWQPSSNGERLANGVTGEPA